MDKFYNKISQYVLKGKRRESDRDVSAVVFRRLFVFLSQKFPFILLTSNHVISSAIWKYNALVVLIKHEIILLPMPIHVVPTSCNKCF